MGITLGVLILILLIPVGVSLLYEGGKPVLRIRVCFLNFALNLGKKSGKKKKPEKKPKKQPEIQPEIQPEPQPDPALQQALHGEQEKLKAAAKGKGSQPQSPETPKKEKTPLSAYLPFVRLAVDFLGSLNRKLRIEKLYLKLILAEEDPCDLAAHYGCAWAGASGLMTLMDRIFVIKDRNIDIQCDFLADRTFLSGRVDLTITIGRILSLALCYGIRALKEFLIFKKRKGGAAI